MPFTVMMASCVSTVLGRAAGKAAEQPGAGEPRAAPTLEATRSPGTR